MKNTKKLISKINKADSKKLNEIERYWAINGYKYETSEWCRIWEAMTNRKLELTGVNLSDPAF